MTHINFKSKFKTQKPKPNDRKIISLHVSNRLFDVVTDVAQNLNITKQDLIRQMIRHCIKDLGHKIPVDTDSKPPTKRIY